MSDINTERFKLTVIVMRYSRFWQHTFNLHTFMIHRRGQARK